ncbi:MAG: alpha/beta fold hydrolase [Ramlibacter sp.]
MSFEALPAARLAHTPCGDGTMAWRSWGEGPPVVLLHGGSGSWTHWLRNIPALVAAGRTVWAPDLPGFGESASPPGGEDGDAIVEPLLAGLGQRVPGPFDLVAFSFGTLVATLAAARAPRVRRLVLAGAPVLPLDSGKGVEMAPWRHLATQEERDAVHARNLRAMMLHRPESITPLAIAVHAANVPQDRMRRRRLVTTRLLADTLARLRCPLWLLYGQEDVLYRGRWSELEAELRALPTLRETVFLPDAGHWVQFEEPAAFDAHVLRMLAC